MSILLTESRKEDLRKKYAKKFEGGTGLDFILNIADLEDLITNTQIGCLKM